jgi:hypothetical protein
MITKSRLVIFLMIVILSGCVMLDPYNIYLFSDAERTKEFELGAWMPSISNDAEVSDITKMLNQSGIENIETCTVDADSRNVTYRSSWVNYDVNCAQEITFVCDGNAFCVLSAGAKW